ncbi:hypothetical protein M1615_04110 [Patescibacteria group bacterium]|nr:hypothetical protein [Patescibacteria group bacterium]MCL5010577.1 hypothetical protein [Patescibacteria group bacterium]
MKLLANVLKRVNKSSLKYKGVKEETLVKQGREQFKKLIEKGLGVPIALL